MAAKFSRCGPVTIARLHGGRLQDIVPAAPRERASHEHDIGDGKQAGQLADGIEQHYARAAPYPPG